MNQPRIKQQLTFIDFAIEAISAICLLFLLGLSVAINQFGENFSIPTNGYGSVWFFAAKGLFVYLGLTILGRFPHIFSYPIEVTTENAIKLYSSATRILRLVKMLIMLSFAFFSIGNAGIMSGIICRIFILIFFILIIGLVWFSIMRMMKK